MAARRDVGGTRQAAFDPKLGTEYCPLNVREKFPTTLRLANRLFVLIFLLATAQIMSGCARQPVTQLAQSSPEEKTDRCVELFETAWDHIDAMREFRPAQPIEGSKFLKDLFGGQPEVERRDAYERERARLNAVRGR